MKAVPRGYPTRIYPIANRQSGHHRTTSRVQVQAKVKRQRQTVTVQQIVIVTVVRTAIVQQIVRLIVFVQIVTVLLVKPATDCLNCDDSVTFCDCGDCWIGF